MSVKPAETIASSNASMPDSEPNDPASSPRSEPGYTTPEAMRRRNIITGLTIITVVIVMVAVAILIPTLKS